MHSKSSPLPEINLIYICLECHNVYSVEFESCGYCDGTLIPYLSQREYIAVKHAVAQRLREILKTYPTRLTIANPSTRTIIKGIEKLISELEGEKKDA